MIDFYIFSDAHNDNFEMLSINGERYLLPFMGIANAYLQEINSGSFYNFNSRGHLAVYSRLGFESHNLNETGIAANPIVVKDLKVLFDAWLHSPSGDRSTVFKRIKKYHSLYATADPEIIDAMLKAKGSGWEVPDPEINVILSYLTLREILFQLSSQPVPFFLSLNKSFIRSSEKVVKRRHVTLGGIETRPIDVAKDEAIVIPEMAKQYRPIISDDHENDGLLQFAYAEISYCIENNISLKYCGEGHLGRGCGRIFVKSPKHKNYCSDQCAIEAQKKSRKR